MTNYIALFGTKKDLRFLTIKGEGYQKIGKVNDLVRKVSDTYYIVREKNKKSEGYHYHCLIDMKIEPNKAWFKKGVHMNLLKVGRANTKDRYVFVNRDLTDMDIAEWKEEDPVMAMAYQENAVVDKRIDAAIKSCKQVESVKRIIAYMNKEQEFPALYTDYILCVNKKI